MMRIAWRAILLAALLLGGLLTLFTVYRLAPIGLRCTMRRIWSRMLLALAGVSLQVGRPAISAQSAPMLVVMNHVSWLDIFVLNSALPSTFIAKSEIRRWPLVGWLLVGTDTLFIERANRHAVRHVNHQIVARIQCGEHVAFFPESTTTDGTLVLPFHSSLFAMAVVRSRNGDAPRDIAPPRVQPVALRYFQRGEPSLIPAYVGEQTFIDSVFRILGARDLQVRLRFCEPMMPADPEVSRQALAQMAHERVRAALDGLG